MPTKEEVSITEIEEFEPSRVDGVGKGANGFPILMLKQVDGETVETEATLEDVLAELDKADADDRPPCKLCSGSGKIKAGHVKCPKCQGSGVMPMPGDTTKTLADLAAVKEAGVAESGSGETPSKNCGTCKGMKVVNVGPNEIQCPDCGGTGQDEATTNAAEQHALSGDPGKITVGDEQGREKIDKALEDRYGITEAEYLEKRKMDPDVGGGVDRDKIDAADFAGKDRSFPIVKPGDVSDAASSIGRAGSDNYSSDKLKANIIAIAKRKGASFVAELPKAWTDDAEKADAASLGGSVFSAANPSLSDVVASDGSGDDGTDDGSSDDDATVPGSPAWEAVDAATATAAATALMTAAELMRTFAQREAQEVIAGEGNDVFDAWAATDAICGVNAALGVMAQLAFHEGLEAGKSLDDDEVVEKAGRRLAGKTVAALAAARDKAKDLSDHITGVLGDDDPATKKDDTTKSFIANANKAIAAIDMAKLAEEIQNMETDELEKALDARDEKLVGIIAEALKNSAPAEKTVKQDVDNTDSIAGGKTANSKAKTKKPKDDDTDLEDEANQGDNDSASSPAKGAAKAADEVEKSEEDMTPEELAAHQQLQAAKQLMKEAKKAQKQAAKDAAVAKEVREGIEEATKAFETLQDRLGTVDDLRARLATVEKMAQPNTIVRAATTEDAAKSRQRDEISMEVARLESLARNATDREVRKAYEDRAADERTKLTTLGA